MSRGLYLKALRRMTLVYPDLCVRVEGVVGVPAEADLIWIRVVSEGHPRFGPALDCTGWERWRLDRNGERFLANECQTVIRVA